MSRATTITFCQDVGVVSSNASALGDYYDAQIIELGKLGLLTAAPTQAGTSGNKSYQAPAEAIELYGVFYGGAHVPLAGLRELEAIAGDWRSQESGPPLVATIEGEGDKHFSFYPTPNANAVITLLVSQIQTDAPTWLEGHLALGALAREFSRETAQQDMNFSKAAQFLANLFGKLVF
jgi:hypothetical protein